MALADIAPIAPIEGITRRVQELGRIRLGEKGDRGQPKSLQAFRLTSYDPAILAACADRYGGRVRDWKDAPDPGMYELYTEAKALEVYIVRSLRAVSQWWELWKGGVCERRCDGRLEQVAAVPCVCGTARGTADGLCDVMTRVSVILRGIPGTGLWRLDTGGYNAATTIPATIDFLLDMDEANAVQQGRTPRALVPAVLRAVMRSSKVRGADGRVTTHRFVTAVVDDPNNVIDQVAAGQPQPEALPETVEARRPMTAQERVAAERARVEASNAAGTMPAPAEEPTAGGTTSADHAPDPVRTTTVASGAPDEASSAGAGAEGEAATSAPLPSPAPTKPDQCESTSDPAMPPVERCRLFAGHKGVHRAQGISWPNP